MAVAVGLLSQGSVTDMLDEKVVQPLLVTSSALTLATECVRMILKVRSRCCHEYWVLDLGFVAVDWYACSQLQQLSRDERP